MQKEIKRFIVNQAKKEIKKPLYQISDRFAKPVISLYLIKNDLDEIMYCLNRVGDYIDKENELVSALWKNAIVTYGKIFTKSDDGYTSLEKKDCINNDKIELHDELIRLRNSYIAHRGNNDIENCLLLMYEKRENGHVSFEFTIPTAIQIGHIVKEIDDVKELINDLHNKVDVKLHKKLSDIDKMLWNKLFDKGIVKSRPKSNRNK